MMKARTRETAEDKEGWRRNVLNGVRVPIKLSALEIVVPDAEADLGADTEAASADTENADTEMDGAKEAAKVEDTDTEPDLDTDALKLAALEESDTVLAGTLGL